MKRKSQLNNSQCADHPLRIMASNHREIRFADVYHLTPVELDEMASHLNIAAFFQSIANLPQYKTTDTDEAAT